MHQAYIRSATSGGLLHVALDSHHSGQIQAITTVAVPCGQRGGQIAPTGRQSDAE